MGNQTASIELSRKHNMLADNKILEYDVVDLIANRLWKYFL